MSANPHPRQADIGKIIDELGSLDDRLVANEAQRALLIAIQNKTDELDSSRALAEHWLNVHVQVIEAQEVVDTLRIGNVAGMNVMADFFRLVRRLDWAKDLLLPIDEWTDLYQDMKDSLETCIETSKENMERFEKQSGELEAALAKLKEIAKTYE